MKVYIDFELNGTGKSKFLERLMPALKDIGVDCSFSSSGCDIALGIAWQNNPVKDMPYVLRLDGLSFHKEKWRYKATIDKTRKSVKRASAVIWQSQFCKSILGQVFPIAETKKQFVIFNGANPKDYENVKPIECPYPRRILLSAHWFKKRERPNKRLNEMMDLLTAYCGTRYDTVVWVAGETNQASRSENIVMLGHLKEEELRRYIVSSTVMLYLAHYDWCPNAVVEALVAGTPVICAKGSGVEELVGSGLPLDKAIRVEDLYKPPPAFNYELVWKALDEISPIRVSRPDLHIGNTAKQYKDAFERTLNDNA